MIVVVGTRGRGGIFSVIQAISATELSSRWNFIFVPSHDSVNLTNRLALAFLAGLKIFWLGLFSDVKVLHLHAAMRGSFWRKSIYVHLGHLVRVASILHLHGSEMKIFYQQQGKFAQWLIYRTLMSTDRVVVLSESWRDFVLNVAPAARVELVYNFVPMPDSWAIQIRQPNQPLRIAFLGFIGDRKGIFDLVQAISEICIRRPGQIELLVGGNGEIARLERVVNVAGLTNSVKVLGWVDSVARVHLLKSSHALALPSYNEGLPMALLEAMSYGLPVLTTKVGGIPELVEDGCSGYLIEPGDQEAMIDRLELWLTRDEERQQMGKAARARVERYFSADHAIARLEEIYTSLGRNGGQQ